MQTLGFDQFSMRIFTLCEAQLQFRSSCEVFTCHLVVWHTQSYNIFFTYRSLHFVSICIFLWIAKKMTLIKWSRFSSVYLNFVEYLHVTNDLRIGYKYMSMVSLVQIYTKCNYYHICLCFDFLFDIREFVQNKAWKLLLIK